VLIRIAAAGVNGPDILQRNGLYEPPPDASPLLGLEAAGTVVALGAGADPVLQGAAVVALCNGGGYAEFVAVPAGQVLALPENWSMAEGAALPETFFTIQQTLIGRAGLRPGQTVLIHGGAGGIGGAAIQMARLAGAIPFATVSTPQKAEYALSLGAEAAILYRNEDFVERVRALTGGRGADIVVDVVGGDNTARNLRAVAVSGTIVQLAALAGESGPINPALLVRKQLTWFGSVLRPQSAAAKAGIAEALRRDVWPAIAEGRIVRPRLRSFALEAAADAHRAFEARDHFGKIVLLAGP
jgi:putative PIG3 family NAD(P)H quinone oxidoreductase